MTKEIETAYPLPLRVLGGFLVFFAIRDLLSIGGTYAALQTVGIRHPYVWNFSAYPREASLYMFQHLILGVAVLSMVALWSRSKYFPWVFSAYYVCLIAINVATVIMYKPPHGIGGIIGHSILCAPWLLYLFKSQRARNVFRDLKPNHQSTQTDHA